MVVEEDQVIDEEEIIDEEVVEEQETIEKPEVSEEEPEIDQEEDDEEDRIVTIGDAPPEDAESSEEDENQETPGWVKKVRKVNRKQEAEIKRLKRQLEANQKAMEKEKPIELGKEPTLASCNFDDKKYAEEVIAYHDRKRKVEEQAAQKAKLVEEQNKAYRARQELYVQKKQEHSFKDYEDVESLVSNTLSETQQGIIIQGAEDSALLVYALGKNPKKLEELSKAIDPIDFTFKVAKLESQLKVTNKKAPAPEKRVSSGKSGGISGSADKTLDRLRTEAEKTGDYTKVLEYKRKLRSK